MDTAIQLLNNPGQERSSEWEPLYGWYLRSTISSPLFRQVVGFLIRRTDRRITRIALHGNATSEHSATTKMTETRKEAKQNRTYSTLFSVVGFFAVIARLTLSNLFKINGDRRNFDFVGNTHIEAHLSWNNRDEDWRTRIFAAIAFLKS